MKFETALRTLAEWAAIPIEAMAALIIAVGVTVSFVRLIRHRAIPDLERFLDIRLFLARYLVLALEFQLASDILATAVTPDWNQIGKLGAIAFIRTFLNYFLVREMKEEEQELGGVPPHKKQRDRDTS